jgi:hypothetical protein
VDIIGGFSIPLNDSKEIKQKINWIREVRLCFLYLPGDNVRFVSSVIELS